MSQRVMEEVQRELPLARTNASPEGWREKQVVPAVEVALQLSLGVSTVWAKVEEGGDSYDPDFPQPIRRYLGTNRTVWLQTEIDECVRREAAKRRHIDRPRAVQGKTSGRLS